MLSLGENSMVPPEAIEIVQSSKMELNTHCSKIVRRVMEKTVPWTLSYSKLLAAQGLKQTL